MNPRVFILVIFPDRRMFCTVARTICKKVIELSKTLDDAIIVIPSGRANRGQPLLRQKMIDYLILHGINGSQILTQSKDSEAAYGMRGQICYSQREIFKSAENKSTIYFISSWWQMQRVKIFWYCCLPSTKKNMEITEVFCASKATPTLRLLFREMLRLPLAYCTSWIDNLNSVRKRHSCCRGCGRRWVRPVPCTFHPYSKNSYIYSCIYMEKCRCCGLITKVYFEPMLNRKKRTKSFT